jgi:hypothetical protein
LDGTIVDGNINAAAGIQQSKLATLVIGDALITDVAASKITGSVGTTQLAFDTVQGGTSNANSHLKSATITQYNIGNLAVTDAKINDVAFGKITGTIIPSVNTITSAMIVDGSIVNADINASAGIDASKLLANSVTRN